jgi:hypothetical protein
MVCLENICINTLQKGAKDDDDDNVTNTTSTVHYNHREAATFYKGKYPA